MVPRIVAGLLQSEGIAEDACHRLKTEAFRPLILVARC